MTYQVLARKWRPQDFESVVGQEPIVTALRNALREGRIAQAYLFSGIRGVGKTSVARILAKALNCERGIENGPCNECETCREVGSGASLDILEIDAATRRSLELTRTLAGDRKGALLAVIDRTVTGPGARQLAARLAAPLTDPAEVNARLDMVQFFADGADARERVRGLLKGAPDMERAVSRLMVGRGGPRDLAAVRDGLSLAPDLRTALAGCREKLPPKPQQALAARLEGRGGAPDATLAEGLGMTKNTFLQNITRARKLLKECLRLAGFDLDAGLA